MANYIVIKLNEFNLEGLFESMANNNENKNVEIENIDIRFDFEEMEGCLSKQLEESFSDLEILERDREKISNPDALGKIVFDEVWKQFSNQIGLDITNETLIQKYDRNHPEEYKDIANSVMQDSKYKDANKEMKDQQQAGTLMDEYTGESLQYGEQANLDHVVSRKEIYENQRRKQANLSVAELANKKENLKPTNEALNKSKGAKSIEEYMKNRDVREKSIIEQNIKANKKVDESNKSDLEKRLQTEKNNKLLNNKLAADDDLMMKADKEARAEINETVLVNATKEVGKKAGKDALKAMAISALFRLSREIMNGLIRFLKEKSKSFNGFLSEMKESIKMFFAKILRDVQTGASTLIGTILSEIFGPIVSLFKKLASAIKQGISSVMEAIKYLRNEENKDKPFAVKIAEIGKIITVGLVGLSAMSFGSAMETSLLTIPGMQIEIPLIGTLANMIGLFFSSLVSGLIGAIILNFIDKFIAKKLKNESGKQIITKKNEIMNLQQKQIFAVENKVTSSRDNMVGDIVKNHAAANREASQILNKIFNDNNSNSTNTVSTNQRDLEQMQKDLEGLI